MIRCGKTSVKKPPHVNDPNCLVKGGQDLYAKHPALATVLKLCVWILTPISSLCSFWELFNLTGTKRGNMAHNKTKQHTLY